MFELGNLSKLKQKLGNQFPKIIYLQSKKLDPEKTNISVNEEINYELIVKLSIIFKDNDKKSRIKVAFLYNKYNTKWYSVNEKNG